MIQRDTGFHAHTEVAKFIDGTDNPTFEEHELVYKTMLKDLSWGSSVLLDLIEKQVKVTIKMCSKCSYNVELNDSEARVVFDQDDTSKGLVSASYENNVHSETVGDFFNGEKNYSTTGYIYIDYDGPTSMSTEYEATFIHFNDDVTESDMRSIQNIYANGRAQGKTDDEINQIIYERGFQGAEVMTTALDYQDGKLVSSSEGRTGNFLLIGSQDVSTGMQFDYTSLGGNGGYVTTISEGLGTTSTPRPTSNYTVYGRVNYMFKDDTVAGESEDWVKIVSTTSIQKGLNANISMLQSKNYKIIGKRINYDGLGALKWNEECSKNTSNETYVTFTKNNLRRSVTYFVEKTSPVATPTPVPGASATPVPVSTPAPTPSPSVYVPKISHEPTYTEYRPKGQLYNYPNLIAEIRDTSEDYALFDVEKGVPTKETLVFESCATPVLYDIEIEEVDVNIGGTLKIQVPAIHWTEFDSEGNLVDKYIDALETEIDNIGNLEKSFLNVDAKIYKLVEAKVYAENDHNEVIGKNDLSYNVAEPTIEVQGNGNKISYTTNTPPDSLTGYVCGTEAYVQNETEALNYQLALLFNSQNDILNRGLRIQEFIENEGFVINGSDEINFKLGDLEIYSNATTNQKEITLGGAVADLGDLAAENRQIFVGNDIVTTEKGAIVATHGNGVYAGHCRFVYKEINGKTNDLVFEK